MKRLLLIFSVLISFCYCGVGHAEDTGKIYIDPKVAQLAINKHFSHMVTQYFNGNHTDLDDAKVLTNVIDAYNDTLKQNDGFMSVDGILNVCKTAFGGYVFWYTKGNTALERKQAFVSKCNAFVEDLMREELATGQQAAHSSESEQNTTSGCPYTVSKVNGSQMKIKYTLPNNSGFIRSGGSIAWRFFNPGNLRGSDLQCTTIRTKPNGNFAVFPNAETGRLALHKLLTENSSYRNSTVREAIYKYAPPSQNNTVGYINKLKNAGINVDAKLSSLSDSQMNQLEEMIITIEGWKKTGTETSF